MESISSTSRVEYEDGKYTRITSTLDNSRGSTHNSHFSVLQPFFKAQVLIGYYIRGLFFLLQ